MRRTLVIAAPIVLIAATLLSVGARVACFEGSIEMVVLDLASGEGRRSRMLTFRSWTNGQVLQAASWIAWPVMQLERFIRDKRLPTDDPDLVRIRAAVAANGAAPRYRWVLWAPGSVDLTLVGADGSTGHMLLPASASP